MIPTRELLTLVAWLTAAWLLAALTWHVQAATGQMTADIYWTDAVAAMRSEPMTVLMRTLHVLQGKLVAVAIVLWAGTLASRRRWLALLLLAAMVPAGMLANSALKMLVERPRPALLASVGSHGFAYPSGHTAAITLFCGYLVVLSFRRTTRWSWRAAAVAAAMVVVGMVALSRVYLGVHRPSDVLAAVLLGVAWLGLCLWCTQWLGRATRSAAA